MVMRNIRPEEPADVPDIRSVLQRAFETGFEADLVDTLRRQGRPLVSLVAIVDGTVVGHILFSPVTLSSDPQMSLMGLAPMAVAPDWQRQGIGSLLVHAGVDACRRLGVAGLVVIGHPEYYPRFGFERGSALGLRSEYEVPDDAFMALELAPGALAGKPGTIRYHPAFAES
jgi:putative acetyltransferase